MTRKADHAHRIGTRTYRQRLRFAAECAVFLVELVLIVLLVPLYLGGPTR